MTINKITISAFLKEPTSQRLLIYNNNSNKPLLKHHSEIIDFLSCQVVPVITLVQHEVFATTGSQKIYSFCRVVNFSGFANWCWTFRPKCLV